MKIITEIPKRVVTEEINFDKRYCQQLLENIRTGHIGDWNFKNGLPTETYPLHIALYIAQDAVANLSNEDFNKLLEKYGV